MFLSGQPGIFPSGRIRNSNATCESMVSFILHASNTISEKTLFNHQLPSHPKSCVLTGLFVSYLTGFAKACSHSRCAKVLKFFTCMHHWIWFDRHLGERVPHSTISEVSFAALGHGPAAQSKLWNRLCCAENEWLTWEWTIAISLL